MDGWYFKCRKTAATTLDADRRYLAWCARTPDLRDGPFSVGEEFEVHFDFGPTEEAALQKLKARLAN